ncbi:hypothetical protein AMS68_000818 [Peltaster fructicola]|uniref:Uncharacterized protein n=1 Tax=Peltaster fructicola TaxID=286661 RepID=A0A6H0XKZ1_9PEZI|nr:hypothetical protein AMS68_000818 [Peltaster fructicola]
MAKGGKLKAGLDQIKGVDHKLERQKKLQKEAAKKKRRSNGSEQVASMPLQAIAGQEEVEEAQALSTESNKAKTEDAADRAEAREQVKGAVDGWEADEEDEQEDGDGLDGVEIGQLEDESESDSEDEDTLYRGNANADDEDDIPISDIESLASEDKGDIIPHQKLTINNTAALQRSLKAFALPSTLPFSSVQSITSAEPVVIADIDDDLNRELAFYKQSLDAVKEARSQLKKEGVPFSRPTDFFAEMVKSEEQMGKVKQKLVDEAARKKASSDARRQRDLKKFGKAVQVAKLQERDKAKRDTMDKINALKRKRQGAELNATEDDMFDVALEDAAETEKADKADRRAKRNADGPNRKRQKKDEKFGFGGKKRFAKSNDAKSTSDMRGYSVTKMKGRGGKQRPGKSRRART